MCYKLSSAGVCWLPGLGLTRCPWFWRGEPPCTCFRVMLFSKTFYNSWHVLHQTRETYPARQDWCRVDQSHWFPCCTDIMPPLPGYPHNSSHSVSYTGIIPPPPSQSIRTSHTFTYVNRVVEGHGASFNWRLCNYELPERYPAACHHKVRKHNIPMYIRCARAFLISGGASSLFLCLAVSLSVYFFFSLISSFFSPRKILTMRKEPDNGQLLGEPAGTCYGGGLVGGSVVGVGGAIPFHGLRRRNGCDGIRCGHVARGSENG